MLLSSHGLVGLVGHAGADARQRLSSPIIPLHKRNSRGIGVTGTSVRARVQLSVNPSHTGLSWTFTCVLARRSTMAIR
jgi:hypothetical protein